jgi:hypothetical protein
VEASALEIIVSWLREESSFSIRDFLVFGALNRYHKVLASSAMRLARQASFCSNRVPNEGFLNFQTAKLKASSGAVRGAGVSIKKERERREGEGGGGKQTGREEKRGRERKIERAAETTEQEENMCEMESSNKKQKKQTCTS